MLASLPCVGISREATTTSVYAAGAGCSEYHKGRTFLELSYAIWLSSSSKHDAMITTALRTCVLQDPLGGKKRCE